MMSPEVTAKAIADFSNLVLASAKLIGAWLLLYTFFFRMFEDRKFEPEFMRGKEHSVRYGSAFASGIKTGS